MMKKFAKGLTVYSCLAFALFNEDCIGMNIRNTDDSDSSSSSSSLTSSSVSEEWIASHKELVSKACYEEDSFDLLIDEIEQYSDSVEDRKMLYKEIENRWNCANVFAATILDNGTIAVCSVQRFDF